MREISRRPRIPSTAQQRRPSASALAVNDLQNESALEIRWNELRDDLFWATRTRNDDD